jgi:hypothetical protein
MSRHPLDLLRLFEGSKYATSPKPPAKVEEGPGRLHGRRISVAYSTAQPTRTASTWRLGSAGGRLRFLALAAFLLFAIGLSLRVDTLSSSAVRVRELLSRRPSRRTVAVTMLSPYRPVDQNPSPVPVTLNNTLWTFAAVVQDQRTTWQEGNRPRFFVRFIMFYATTDPEVRLCAVVAAWASHSAE